MFLNSKHHKTFKKVTNIVYVYIYISNLLCQAYNQFFLTIVNNSQPQALGIPIDLSMDKNKA